MTTADLEKYFSMQATLANVPATDITKYVKLIISMGLKDFWNIRPWTFRTIEKELDTSVEAETYEVDWPDFGGFGTVREKESLAGRELLFRSKKQFDEEFTKPSAFASGYPYAFTVYKNKASGKWVFKFYPIPSITPIYVEVYTTGAEKIEDVPDEFIGGVRAAVSKYLYPAGSVAGIAAAKLYRDEIIELDRIDTPMQASQVRVLDDTDMTIEAWRPWI
jgi:hypothetical protein